MNSKIGAVRGQIQLEEILRYLGYNGKQAIDAPLSDTIHTAMDEIQSTIQARYIYQSFSLIQTEAGLALENTAVVLPGKDIAAHLAGCKTCILFALTLGLEIEKKIQYRETCSIHEGLIWDTAASAYVEACCDALNKALSQKWAPENLTPRFSCGYGDLPLSLQPQLISLLQAPKHIGLTCSQSNILLPRKSVTAIIGIGAKNIAFQPKCEVCTYQESCTRRKSGDPCGYFRKD